MTSAVTSATEGRNSQGARNMTCPSDDDGQLCGFPGGDAARNFADVRETMAVEETRRDRRSIAAGAEDEQRTIDGQLRQPLGQMIERHGDAASDVLRRAF